MDTLSQPALIGLFLLAAGVVCWAGVHLSRATDALDRAFGWGEAVGGMVLLAIVTNLPEVAIVASAAHGGHLELAAGNILGGIAMQTMVLVVFDAFGNKGNVPLATRAFAPQLQIEGLLVIVVLAIVIMGNGLPQQLVMFRVAPGGLAILAAWLAALWLIGHQRSSNGPHRKRAKHQQDKHHHFKDGTVRTGMVFATMALATLVAGITLELTGDALARHWHIQGAVFGATILAAATSLPEIATGLPAMRRKEYTLALSDIFGGNAFLPVLFVLATLLSGQAALPAIAPQGIYLAGLGIVLTAIYLGAMLVKPARKRLGLGPEAWIACLVYAVGMGGLFFVSRGS